jgi:hypothetical protein
MDACVDARTGYEQGERAQGHGTLRLSGADSGGGASALVVAGEGKEAGGADPEPRVVHGAGKPAHRAFEERDLGVDELTSYTTASKRWTLPSNWRNGLGRRSV